MSTKTRLRFCGGRGFMTLMSIKTANDKTIAEGFVYLAVHSVLGAPLSLPTKTGVKTPMSGGVL